MSQRFLKQLATRHNPLPLPVYSCVVNKFFSVFAVLVGVAVLASFGYALFRYLVPEAPASPVILFASYKSGVNGTLLKFQADGTFQYENMSFGPSDVVTGRYTQSDSFIQLDQLPKTGMLRCKTLLVRPSPATETGRGIWQVGPKGRVDSTLAVFTIFPFTPAK